MTTHETLCADLGRRARLAERTLRCVNGAQKNAALLAIAESLETQSALILQANAQDLHLAENAGLSGAMLDRLRLTPARLRGMAEGIRSVAAQDEPIGRVLASSVRPNGLLVSKVAVPLGVILFIYESRPNVTTDAAALAVKSGNALILRGGKEALHSNRQLHALISQGLASAGLPPDAVQLVTSTDREIVDELLRLKEYIDLVIPRGGESLIRRVEEQATMHVLKHYKGNCHVYVDASANLDKALTILLNAKCQRPGVCNAAESLLIHTAVAREFLERAGPALRQQGVELRVCPASGSILQQLAIECRLATNEDYAEEFLDLILSIKVVANLEEALTHIAQFGSGHSEAILTQDLQAAQRFTREVDAAAVLVNASTRFNDGGELGLGAEIGISTDKFHARGPCGLLELTCYKYIIQGDGQVRT